MDEEGRDLGREDSHRSRPMLIISQRRRRYTAPAGTVLLGMIRGLRGTVQELQKRWISRPHLIRVRAIRASRGGGKTNCQTARNTISWGFEPTLERPSPLSTSSRPPTWTCTSFTGLSTPPSPLFAFLTVSHSLLSPFDKCHMKYLPRCVEPLEISKMMQKRINGRQGLIFCGCLEGCPSDHCSLFVMRQSPPCP
jgi:hypothetical protein